MIHIIETLDGGRVEICKIDSMYSNKFNYRIEYYGIYSNMVFNTIMTDLDIKCLIYELNVISNIHTKFGVSSRYNKGFVSLQSGYKVDIVYTTNKSFIRIGDDHIFTFNIYKNRDIDMVSISLLSNDIANLCKEIDEL